MIEDFNGALSYDDIVYKFTVPQLTIMRLDKPSVEFDSEDDNIINSAEGFFSAIHKK